jgi:glycosyltransferase involved in cell wall biosynthesis
MRILFVTPWFPTENASTVESRQGLFEYRQAKEMVKRGHEFVIITMQWRYQPIHENFGEKIQVYRLKPLYVFPKIRYPVPNIISLDRKIRGICNQRQPNVIVYSHMAFLTALPVLWFKKIPSVVTTDGFPGISWFYGDNKVDFIGRLYTKLIMTKMIKSAQGVQLFSNKLLEDEKKLNVKFNNVFVCSTGVDTDLFKPGTDRHEIRRLLNLSDDDWVVLCVGRLDLVKGVNYLIEAAKIIIQKFGNAKFILVGDGSLRKEYETLASSFPSNIIFLGWREDIPQLMRMADIFVLPSLSEGIPSVIMEASASKLPIIATDVGGISQLISDGENGVLVKPKNVESLVEAIQTLIKEPLTISKMGELGREKMVTNYSWERICNILESGYGKSIKNFTDRYTSK